MRAAKLVLITGASGLVGSEAVAFFCEQGWKVHGVDNNMRMDFFGSDGDTSWNERRLKNLYKDYVHHFLDIRDRQGITELVKAITPHFIIHAAGQPSHDLAARRAFDDFEINAGGTLNLLESARMFCPESPFIYMSTNKVYGDAPNEIPLIEQKTRFDYTRPENYEGVDETCRIDASMHSLFGASKLSADVMVQEYGRYFNMPTACFRACCVTGPSQSGTELHGFLSYMAKCLKTGRVYKIFGYQGKQVRDNLHAFDVCTAFLRFFQNPKKAAVYNLGGCRDNSLSVIEAIKRFETVTECKLPTVYEEMPRLGDHICYISNMNKFKNDYPGWEVTKSLDDIILELVKDPVLT